MLFTFLNDTIIMFVVINIKINSYSYVCEIVIRSNIILLLRFITILLNYKYNKTEFAY